MIGHRSLDFCHMYFCYVSFSVTFLCTKCGHRIINVKSLATVKIFQGKLNKRKNYSLDSGQPDKLQFYFNKQNKYLHQLSIIPE